MALGSGSRGRPRRRVGALQLPQHVAQTAKHLLALRRRPCSDAVASSKPLDADSRLLRCSSSCPPVSLRSSPRPRPRPPPYLLLSIALRPGGSDPGAVCGVAAVPAVPARQPRQRPWCAERWRWASASLSARSSARRDELALVAARAPPLPSGTRLAALALLRLGERRRVHYREVLVVAAVGGSRGRAAAPAARVGGGGSAAAVCGGAGRAWWARAAPADTATSCTSCRSCCCCCSTAAALLSRGRWCLGEGICISWRRVCRMY